MLSYWRFPQNVKQCPVWGCNSISEDRSTAIAHYKKKHANYSILCLICNKPICASHMSVLKNHYRKVHPNEKMQVDFTEKPKHSEQQMPQTNKVSIF